jgi:Putative beta-barrel porin 2
LGSFKYYEHKPIFSTDRWDKSFAFNAGLTHAFSEETSFRASDSFVIGQEPDTLRAGNTFSTFQRVSGDNIRNYGTLSLEMQLTPQFGLGVGYDNAFYDYKDRGANIPLVGTVQPSLAGALNRIENRAHLEAFWRIDPETKLLLGYQFTDFDYNSDELIGGTAFFGTVFDPFYARQRDSREHTVYVGAEHTFLPELTGSIRAGGSYSEYYNAPGADHQYSPYVNAIMKYSYAPESYVEGGFSYDRNATDVVGGGFSAGTLDAESAVVFVDLTHRITPYLFASLMGQFQNSKYHGGAFDNKDEQYYLAGLDFEYRFNQYFSAHAGYNYDRLESKDLGRTFDRNRVYVGVTATY